MGYLKHLPVAFPLLPWKKKKRPWDDRQEDEWPRILGLPGVEMPPKPLLSPPHAPTMRPTAAAPGNSLALRAEGLKLGLWPRPRTPSAAAAAPPRWPHAVHQAALQAAERSSQRAAARAEGAEELRSLVDKLQEKEASSLKRLAAEKQHMADFLAGASAAAARSDEMERPVADRRYSAEAAANYLKRANLEIGHLRQDIRRFVLPRQFVLQQTLIAGMPPIGPGLSAQAQAPVASFL